MAFLPRLAGLLAAFVLLAVPASASANAITGLELLGHVDLPSSLRFEDVPVGGLSGLTYDGGRDLYYAVSDDPATLGPARYLTLRIDLTRGRVDADDVRIEAMTELLDRDGKPFRAGTLDAEGIRHTGRDTLFISSEGQIREGIAPFVREYSRAGAWIRDLPLPRRTHPKRWRARGVRHNLGFEGLALEPAGGILTATENALMQDGPETDVGVGSTVRILRYDPRGRLEAAFAYEVDPVVAAPPEPDGFRTNGLVELLSTGPDRLLALERSYTAGVGNDIRIYDVALAGATDVAGRKRLKKGRYRPVRKTLLVPLGAFGIPLDNLEGLTFGPRLADGRRTLVLVSDNNFSEFQRTQILVFALDAQPHAVAGIQGAGHRSGREGSWLLGVTGTVTARAPSGSGFWIQSAGDGDPATSDALFVEPAVSPPGPELEPGERVVVSGRVTETSFPLGLSVTGLGGAYVRRASNEEREPLPEPIVLGRTGRPIPAAAIDDDGLERFEPELDAIDFLESLEGMRVAIPDAVVVGPTTRFGEIAVLADGGAATGGRSRAGGLLLEAASVNAERLLVTTRDGAQGPRLTVGDRFEEPIVGVLTYAFGTFRVLAEELPAHRPAATPPERTTLGAGPRVLTVASYNVENLSPRSGAEKILRVAETIVANLDAPDVLALQEIQDDTGPDNDGTVSAAHTLGRLIEAIARAGGPVYEAAQIDPVDLADGGRPGSNIRVAYLYRPDRIGLPRRGRPDATTAGEWLEDERGTFLSPNPSRIDPANPAFGPDPAGTFTGVRKPLAVEVEFAGERIFLVNLHMRSKRGDAPLFGSEQPPGRITETLRAGEAHVIRGFLDRLLALDPDAHVIVLGDFNEHPYRPPLAVLAGPDLENLMLRVPAEERYTFIFRGNSQVLDNVLVSAGLAAEGVAEIDVVHCNADFPDGERAADHDPIVLRFNLERRPPERGRF